MSRTLPEVLTVQTGASSVSNRVKAGAWWSRHYGRALFWLVFALPTLVAVLYFGVIASDRYVSETRFIVRSVDKPAAQGAAAYLQSFGIMRANDDAFAIQDFVHSRDLMHELDRRFALRRVWSPDGADFVSRYGGLPLFSADSDEALFRHYVKRVRVNKDLETGITAILVDAYDPRQAQAIARTILQASEARVNAMNARARQDTLAAAERASIEAGARLAAASVALTQARQTAGEVDPTASAGAILERGSNLERELSSLRVALQAMQSRAPGNPALPALRQRVAALEGQVSAQRGQLTGPGSNLAGKVSDIARVEVEAEIAAQGYEAAQDQFSTARENADRQRVFIETIASPNLPDKAGEPRRLRYIFTVALLSFWAFLIAYLLVSGSREHLNLH